jgi:TrmH family RNA methyltransferase
VGSRVDRLAPGVLAKIADAASPQPIVASVRGGASDAADLEVAGDLVLVADSIQDPGNLGALARVAEACGADCLVVTGDAADPFGPKALRASAGSTLRVRVFEGRDAGQALGRLRAAGLCLAVSSPHEGEDFARLTWPARVALILGSEARGLSEELLAAGDLRVMVPMAPGIESLNLSVAAGILAMAISRGLRAPAAGSGGSTIGAMPEAEPS